MIQTVVPVFCEGFGNYFWQWVYRTGELLLSLAGKHTIVVIEHDMKFVRQISQGRKVTVLHQGHVLCEGPVDQVQSDERVMEVYLGRKSKAA